MGLLDDAIREHLELKRRRGADPDEVARQEDEALGDPRSGEFARPEGEAAPEPQADAPEPLADAPAALPPREEDVPPEPPQPAAYAAEPDPAPEAPWLEDDDRVEPVADGPAADFPPPEEGREPDVVRPDDEPGADEDVLEETPDFLQETPEHDRLWFEQKPPRDFDFDN
jgi:hypothetical protein